MSPSHSNTSRTTLTKSLSEKFVWAIAYGSCVGWGAFILPGDWIEQAGPIGTAIGIVIGALMMMIIGFSYGALVKHFPVSGGAFAFAYAGFGRYVSFIASWFLVLGYLCIVALNASAFALLFKFVFPDQFLKVRLYSLAGWDVYLTEIIVASLILIIFAYISIKGTGMSGYLQYLFCLLLALMVVSLFLISFFVGDFSLDNLKPLNNPSVGWTASILSIVAISPWAFVGFDNIPQSAEEFDFPPNKTYKLIAFSLIAAALTYIVMTLVTSWIFDDEADGIWVTGSVIQNSMGVIGLLILSLAISFGIFTGLNGFLMSTSRLMFALGRAKFIPTVFSRLHPKYQTPYISVLFVTIICLLAPWLGRTALVWIVDMSATGVSIAYLTTCLVAFKVFKGRRLYRLISLVGAMFASGFLVLLLYPGSPASLTTPSYIALGVWGLIGMIFFAIRFKDLKNVTNEELDYLILNKQ